MEDGPDLHHNPLRNHDRRAVSTLAGHLRTVCPSARRIRSTTVETFRPAEDAEILPDKGWNVSTHWHTRLRQLFCDGQREGPAGQGATFELLLRAAMAGGERRR